MATSFGSIARLTLTVAASLLIHGGLFAAVRREHREQKVIETVELQVTEIAPPKPPLPEPVKPPAPARPRPERIPVKLAPRPPPPNSEPAAKHPPAPSAEPPPIHVGISLSSTVSTGGGFAVGVGNTLYGKADEKAVDPDDVKPYASKAAFVPATRVSTLPTLLAQPKLEYTPEARKAEIEGQVILMLKIDENGRVTEARLLSGLGYGLDEVAQKSARSFRFSPATLQGDPVPTQIRFTYTFLLE
jgi:protein TonB